MKKAEKTAAIAEIAETVGKTPHAFIIDYKGVKVGDVTEFRRQVRGTKSTYVVLKNTLALRAIKGSALEPLSAHFVGMTGVAYSKDNAIALAKVLHDFGKKVPAIKVKAIILDGKEVPASSLEALASIPSRPELVAKLLGLIQSPVRRLVTVLSGPQRNLAATLAAIAKNKESAA